MLSNESLSSALRAVANAAQKPVLIILLILLASAVILAGTLVAECFTERLRLKARLPKLVDKIRDGGSAIEKIIARSGLLKRQKASLMELTRHPELTPEMREALALELLRTERAHYDGIVKISDMIARLGPIFGLLGTLIPLGPGIIALGRGDTYTLSASMLTAFDTTIAGLIAAAAASVVSAVRRRWYDRYMNGLELVMECVLETLNENTGTSVGYETISLDMGAQNEHTE